MAKAYSKEFLIDVYLSRFDEVSLSYSQFNAPKQNAEKLYDKVGKTEWRKYADVTPERIQQYQKTSV